MVTTNGLCGMSITYRQKSETRSTKYPPIRMNRLGTYCTQNAPMMPTMNHITCFISGPSALPVL